MMRLLCFFGLHDYERQKWGGRVGHPLWLDCRTCNRCRKFQIWAYDGYKNRESKDFGNWVIRPWTELEWTQYYAQDR